MNEEKARVFFVAAHDHARHRVYLAFQAESVKHAQDLARTRGYTPLHITSRSVHEASSRVEDMFGVFEEIFGNPKKPLFSIDQAAYQARKEAQQERFQIKQAAYTTKQGTYKKYLRTCFRKELAAAIDSLPPLRHHVSSTPSPQKRIPRRRSLFMAGMIILIVLALGHGVFLVAEVLTGEFLQTYPSTQPRPFPLTSIVVSLSVVMVSLIGLWKLRRPEPAPIHPPREGSFRMPPAYMLYDEGPPRHEHATRRTLQEMFRRAFIHPQGDHGEEWRTILTTMFMWNWCVVVSLEDDGAGLHGHILTVAPETSYAVRIVWGKASLSAELVTRFCHEVLHPTGRSHVPPPTYGIFIALHGVANEAQQLFEMSEAADRIVVLDGEHIANAIVGIYEFETLLHYAVQHASHHKIPWCPHQIEKDSPWYIPTAQDPYWAPDR